MNNVKYSDIIGPEEYIRILDNEHLYIRESDIVIMNTIRLLGEEMRRSEVVELGCGPGRLSKHLIRLPNINFTGVDIDPVFIEYAQKTLQQEKFKLSDVLTYTHKEQVDIFVSQGFHHHIRKGNEANSYLQNVVSQLSSNGMYIISDEFLPEYECEDERKHNAVVWYSHIIGDALDKGYDFLAHEEAKTLLDELEIPKTEERINYILNNVNIVKPCKKNLELNAYEFHNNLIRNFKEDVDTVGPSRGDYKISFSVLEEEMTKVGLELLLERRIGPKENIGYMGVYVFQHTS